MLENIFDLKNKCDVISFVAFSIVIVSCNFNVDLELSEPIHFNIAELKEPSIDGTHFWKSHIGEAHYVNKWVNYFRPLGNNILKTRWLARNKRLTTPRRKQEFQVARIFQKNAKRSGRCKRATLPPIGITTIPQTEGVGTVNYDDYTDDTTWIPPTLPFPTEYPMDKRHLSYILPKFTLPTTVDVETLDKMVYTGHEYEWTDVIEMIGTRKEPRTPRVTESVERAWEEIVWSSEESPTPWTGKTPDLGTIWTPYDFNRLKARISSRSSLSAWWAKTSTVNGTS